MQIVSDVNMLNKTEVNGKENICIKVSWFSGKTWEWNLGHENKNPELKSKNKVLD